MIVSLWLLAVQGLIGAFDTLYYHEYRARLPARGRAASLELKLHAARDFLYGVLFLSLPWVQWRGRAPRTRGRLRRRARDSRRHGDPHGAMIGYLVPTLAAWWNSPTALLIGPAPG